MFEGLRNLTGGKLPVGHYAFDLSVINFPKRLGSLRNLNATTYAVAGV